ncbi:MAG: LamG domain-containing protein [Vulcanococcus sp.]
MTYPAFTPSSRTWTPGEYANTAWLGYSGSESRVRNINAMQESALRLEYIGLSESDMLSFLTHYVNSSGSYGAFTLPSAAFSGVSSASDYTLSGYLWRYEDAPMVEDLPCGGHNVSIALVSVIPEGAFADGVELEISISFSAPTPVSARGANLDLQVQLKPGVATGSSPGTVSGATLTIAMAIIGGAGGGGAGGASVSGLTAVITASITGGTGSTTASVAGITATVGLGYSVDTDFSSVVLLLKMNGTNGSTTITDSSSSAKAMTANGNAQISTARSKFDGASLLLDGTGDFASTPTSADFDFGTGDFTIEAWVYIAANSTAANDGTRSAAVVSCYAASGSQDNSYTFGILGNSTTTGTGLYFTSVASGTNSTLTTSTAVSQAAWHHVAASRSGTTTRLFVDGQLDGSGTLTNQNVNTDHELRVGSSRYAGFIGALNGNIDECRVTKGVARYTAAFTPPAAPFPVAGPGATGQASASGITATVTVSLDPGAASV